MSYPDRGNILRFFQPMLNIAGNNTKPLAAINIAIANATHGEYVCVVPCVLRKIQGTVMLNVVSTSTPPQIVYKKYTLPNGGGTATTIDSVIVPDASTIGQTYYVNNLSTSFVPGQVLQLSHIIGTGGSVAGEILPAAVFELDPEVSGNNTLEIASA